MLDMLILIAVIASSIWVYVDAKQLNADTAMKNGASNLSPFGWMFFCLVLWVLGFPMYLFKRMQYKRLNGLGSSNKLASSLGFGLVALVVLSIALAATGHIKLGTDELQPKVEQSIREHFEKTKQLAGVKVHKLDLVHKEGNTYLGLLQVSEGGEEETLKIDVTYDGKTFMWKVVP